jgi:hypothetical protein
METQQMTELLLATIDANTKANRDLLARMEAEINANHKRMMAKLRTWREERKTDREARKTTDLKRNQWYLSRNIGRSLGRCRGETGQRTEDAALGPEASCKATRRAKGTDTRRLWIRDEVGCLLQEGVLSCSSGTAQEKCPQENSDPGKLWTVEGIGCSRKEDDPLYKSVTERGTRASGTQS